MSEEQNLQQQKSYILENQKKVNELVNKLDKIIYNCETHYLEQTSSTGNILKGWEHIFTSKAKNFNLNNNSNKRPKISPLERLFSGTKDTFISLKEDFLSPEKINGDKLVQQDKNAEKSRIKLKTTLRKKRTNGSKKVKDGKKDGEANIDKII